MSEQETIEQTELSARLSSQAGRLEVIAAFCLVYVVLAVIAAVSVVGNSQLLVAGQGTGSLAGLIWWCLSGLLVGIAAAAAGVSSLVLRGRAENALKA
jgi:hypothetical protein